MAPKIYDFGWGTIDVSGSQWVDKRGAKRTTPMQVLVMGMPRTSTASMYLALHILEYSKVYHMLSVFQNPLDAPIWEEAANAKWFGKGKPFGREEFDQVLGDCQAVTDFPTSAFAPDLIAAYPEAKVVLTVRDVDSWYNSFYNTIVKAVSSNLMKMVAYSDPGMIGPWFRMSGVLMAGYFGTTDYSQEEKFKKRYVDHYEEIRRIVPKERLLEFKVQDGWEPLCKFLGKEVPEKPYPKANDSSKFDQIMETMLISRLMYNVQRVVFYVAPLATVGVAAYLARRNGLLGV